ncbi:hypothetical protein C7999DRAFT_32722 [Corynascus novoguineensis]|uniref:Uncharacterized protein n=1 Tax=Corynascus novoguineensis TaxID=1126955 RepID=A0AAN7CR93_9PEZI|nr:hypothetical protein C7999DRAFT_32722 [Corynascus novoguineensis]
MKRGHIALPALKLVAAAALFFASTALAEPYCVDTRSVAARHNDHGNGDLESSDPAKPKQINGSQ